METPEVIAVIVGSVLSVLIGFAVSYLLCIKFNARKKAYEADQVEYSKAVNTKPGNMEIQDTEAEKLDKMNEEIRREILMDRHLMLNDAAQDPFSVVVIHPNVVPEKNDKEKEREGARKPL